jgi:putative ATP-dependent endonuclease of the OLD family
MLLCHVDIQNFRAIRTISLDVDRDTTVLIGENGSGKTSFFEALDACLGARPDGPELSFDRRDFRLVSREEEDGATYPIQIVLEFREREPGEWDNQLDEFGAAIIPRTKDTAQLRIQVTAVWNSVSDGPDVTCEFLDASEQPIPNLEVDELVTELRRLNPFLTLGVNHRQLAEDGLSAFESAEELLGQSRTGGANIEAFTREIYDKLMANWEDLTPQDMKKARGAAKRIWRRMIQPRPANGQRPRTYRLPSGGAQSLGPLLVFGALLKARGARPLDEDVEPIFGAEHFGAHLHPSTLGSVRYVIESLPVQRIISTYSREIVAAMPLHSLRRFVRRRSGVDVYQFHESRLKKDDRRRLGYHIRARRGGAIFDRCWLLVEGESEYWLMPEMARLCGYEFDAEGVGVVEFAQCGITPILELAKDLGISWHMLVDGDDAGGYYVEGARKFLNGADPEQHITRLPLSDVEHYLWQAGYSDVYVKAARFNKKRGGGKRSPDNVIGRAISARSKPFLAVSVVEACARMGSPGVPKLLRETIERTVRLARTN